MTHLVKDLWSVFQLVELWLLTDFTELTVRDKLKDLKIVVKLVDSFLHKSYCTYINSCYISPNMALLFRIQSMCL